MVFKIACQRWPCMSVGPGVQMCRFCWWWVDLALLEFAEFQVSSLTSNSHFFQEKKKKKKDTTYHLNGLATSSPIKSSLNTKNLGPTVFHLILLQKTLVFLWKTPLHREKLGLRLNEAWTPPPPCSTEPRRSTGSRVGLGSRIVGGLCLHRRLGTRRGCVESTRRCSRKRSRKMSVWTTIWDSHSWSSIAVKVY